MAFRFGYREIVAVSALVMLIAVAIVAVKFEGVEERVDPNISLDVESTWTTDEEVQNVTPVAGKIWQVMEVKITNMNKKSPFQVSVTHFYAHSDRGDRYWLFNGEDFTYGPIEPGENQTVTLIFHIPEGTTLAKLEYVQKLSSTAQCEIPSVLE